MSDRGEIAALLLADVKDGVPAESNRDALGLALALSFPRELIRVAVLAEDALSSARKCSEMLGADVLSVSGEGLSPYSGPAFLAALTDMAERLTPRFMILPHSSLGMDLAPALAARLSAACVTGVSRVEDAGLGPVLARVSADGGREEIIRPLSALTVLTALPGSFPVEAPEKPGAVSEIARPVLPPAGVRFLGCEEGPAADLALAAADVIVCAGRGVGCPENLALVEELAGVFPRSAVAGSRPVCDAGWLPANRQVGVTGATVAPRLYIACGVSGAFQHLAGMSGAKTIVAVNRDPAAPIFSAAHVGVAEDLVTFIPLLIDALKK